YLYITGDIFAAIMAWCIFYLFRKLAVEEISWDLFTHITGDPRFRWGIVAIPLYWITWYFLFNFYTDIYRKSRLTELSRTIGLSLLGCVILFFGTLLDDRIRGYSDYYLLIGALFIIHAGITLISRMLILTWAKSKIRSGKYKYNTVIVGGTQQATNIYKAISKRKDGSYNFKGFVSVNELNENGLSKHLPSLGKYQDLPKIIADNEIEDVVVAIESSEHNLLYKIINQFLGQKIRIRILPDAFDFITGIHTGDIIGEALIEIEDHPLPPWQRAMKRLFDIVFSALVLIFASPLFLGLGWKVKRSSPGQVFFFQERIGQYGQPFRMVKFRSMYKGAEDDGPQLSKTEDPRITPFGRTLRKYRLDELPQFFNVLIGNMSLVGPRPERSHFI
ncbi:MAG TPA: exopolysaccharide biosynthesis polyprenyl glycosylphosphotransferase, partial [Chitinophagaceae bacterium]|nr:exopolysaccharide biosynthesis polyprenyl glycosylphosphotransferase [Chitinophagaceae bacterium]